MDIYLIYPLVAGVRGVATTAKCANDADAITLAQRLITAKDGKSQVWAGQRLVATVGVASKRDLAAFGKEWA